MKFIRLCISLALVLTSLSGLASNLPDFTELVEENSRAVVNISTTQKMAQRKSGLPPGFEVPENSPYGELFRHFFLVRRGNSRDSVKRVP